MSRYYDVITEKTELSHKSGSALVVSPDFRVQSSMILAQCSFMQNVIQRIIYTSHGAELVEAKKTLRQFPNPKARVEFLCSFPYKSNDFVVQRIFDFARELFFKLYEFRNVLAHEVWSSSEDYPGCVLFSSLDENARLLLASGRLWHERDMTPRETFDATIRFIRSVKVVTHEYIALAIRDAELCAWCLSQVDIVLTESDPQRRDEVRRAFLVYRGTSHLFVSELTPSDPVDYSAARSKVIGDPA